MNSIPIAAQMYTVRDQSEKDFVGALQRVAEMGYRGVELAGTYGLDADTLREVLNEAGLTCVAGHVPRETLLDALDEQISLYRTLGASFIVCPWLAPDLRKTTTDYRARAAELNRFGEACQAGGIGFAYHHHDFELMQFEGKHGLDILLEETEPEYVKLEADTYWLKAGGVDPATYVRKWAGRVPLMHLKDMDGSTPPDYTEVGDGILQWPSIFEAANAAGTHWFIVEHDEPSDSFASLERSFQNLEKLLG